MVDYQRARHNMVEGQLRTNKVNDQRILSAFETLPRERFVPEAAQGFAYIDEDLALTGQRYMLEPLVLARLIQEALVEPSDIALDVACGSGYACAVLANLAATVIGIESDASLVQKGSRLLRDLDITNAVVLEGDLTAGAPQHGPYDFILIEGAVELVSQALVDQLADGGRLATVMVGEDGVGRGTLFRRDGEVVSQRSLFDASVRPLAGFARPPSFVF